MRDAWPLLAESLEYPGPRLVPALRELLAVLPEGPAAVEVRAFLDEAGGASPGALEEAYVRTFDLAPACAPYLGVHLFGDGNPRRAPLLTGLAARYAEAGLAADGEVPDHLARVLRFAPHAAEDEWADLVRWALRPALAAMVEAGGAAPWPRLVRAAAILVAADRLEEEPRA